MSLPPPSLAFQKEGVGLNESKLMSCEPPSAAGCEHAESTVGLESVPVPSLLMGDTFLFLTTAPKPQSWVICQLPRTSEYPVHVLDPLCVLRAWKLFSLSLTCQHVPHVSRQLFESEMVGPKQRGRRGGVVCFHPSDPRNAHDSFCGLC